MLGALSADSRWMVRLFYLVQRWIMMNKWLDGCVETVGYAIVTLAVLSFILKNCGGW